MIKIGSGNWIVDNKFRSGDLERQAHGDLAAHQHHTRRFKGSGVWNVIVNINGALQAIGYALLVLFL